MISKIVYDLCTCFAAEPKRNCEKISCNRDASSSAQNKTRSAGICCNTPVSQRTLLWPACGTTVVRPFVRAMENCYSPYLVRMGTHSRVTM